MLAILVSCGVLLFAFPVSVSMDRTEGGAGCKKFVQRVVVSVSR